MRHFSDYFTLHHGDIATWATPLDSRLFAEGDNDDADGGSCDGDGDGSGGYGWRSMVKRRLSFSIYSLSI